MHLQLRILNPANSKDVTELQRVLEEAPTYSLNVSGAPQTSSAAKETFEALPDNFQAANKFVLGIFQDNQMIGCIDLLRGFPDSATAMLGLLLLSENRQKNGLGLASFREAENLIRTWTEIKKIRIGVVLTNGDVLNFWKKCGFVETGVLRPYENGSVRSQSVILEKPLH